MSKQARPRGLGRGLDALLPLKPPSEAPVSTTTPVAEPSANGAKPTLFVCPIERIVPCRSQPRQNFDAAALDELTASIQSHGVLEPLVVRRLPGEDRFEIVAGGSRHGLFSRLSLYFRHPRSAGWEMQDPHLGWGFGIRLLD